MTPLTRFAPFAVMVMSCLSLSALPNGSRWSAVTVRRAGGPPIGLCRRDRHRVAEEVGRVPLRLDLLQPRIVGAVAEDLPGDTGRVEGRVLGVRVRQVDDAAFVD